MSDKTNDEKLKILQERLAQIKGKQNTASDKIDNIESEIEVNTTEEEATHKVRKPMLFKLFKVFILSFFIAFGVKYAYNNIDSNSFFTELTSSEEAKEEVTSTNLEYTLDLEGKNIAIINSFKDESSAKAMANNLAVKGFKCDYFFLPNKSNSTEKVYKVFIGPYESLEEVNQWKENVNGEVEILNL